MIVPLLVLGGLGALVLLSSSSSPDPWKGERSLTSADADNAQMKQMMALSVYAAGGGAGQNDRLAGKPAASDPASVAKETGYDLTDSFFHAKYNEGYEMGYHPSGKSVT